jgi:hypothetical protein
MYQLGVTVAERAGVSPAVLRAVLADNADAIATGRCTGMETHASPARAGWRGRWVTFDHGRVPALADVAASTA